MRTGPESPATVSRRKAVNLSVDPLLPAFARRRGLNLSRLLEDGRRALPAAEGVDAFADENAEAVAAYNTRVREAGAFGEDLQTF